MSADTFDQQAHTLGEAATLSLALTQRLTAMADDELILAHRAAEWTGHAPILEEDIALANIAQDELGHALLWYDIVQQISGHDPDQLAMFRSADAFLNAQLVELPRGDWAFTMLRQFLFDSYEYVLLGWLKTSAHQAVAAAAAKAFSEEIYHLRHSQLWVERLGLGTQESHDRLQAALNELWPFTFQVFQAATWDRLLVDERIFPELKEIRTAWSVTVLSLLEQAELTLPGDAPPVDSPRGSHTGHMDPLLAELQLVARRDPGAIW